MIIQTEELVKTYVMGTSVVHALDGVSISIEKGDMVAVTGASGSGKTTLMNMSAAWTVRIPVNIT